MIRAAFVIAFTLIVSQANATDRALILTDEELTGLRQLLDLAVKQSGMQVAPFAVYINNKINSASIVKEREGVPGDHIPGQPPEKKDAK